MKLTEKSRESRNAWDRDNMHSITCRIRKYDADLFKEYCERRNTTPATVVKQFVYECIKQDYGDFEPGSKKQEK